MKKLSSIHFVLGFILGFALFPWNIGLAATQDTPTSVQASANRLNLNEASIKDLTSLPSIGKTKAKAIVAYRDAHGPFQSLEALLQVKGVSQRIIAIIKPMVVV